MMMGGDRKPLERAFAVVNDHPGDIAFSNDSDAPVVHFFAAPRPAVSIWIDDPDEAIYVRLDRAEDEVVGLR